MKFNFKTFFKDINEDGQGTACLEFYMEVIDPDYRDEVMAKIMKILSEDPEEDEIEEKPGVLGFDTGSSGTEAPDDG